MYNIICILTILLYIHTNSFFCEKKGTKFIRFFVFDKKLLSVVIPVKAQQSFFIREVYSHL